MGGRQSLHDPDEGGQVAPLDETDSGSRVLLTGKLSPKSYWCGDVRAAVVYVTIFGIFVGLGIPLIIHFADPTGVPGPIYGSCMIKEDFRFKCLLNKLENPTENECINALCCWENNDTLPFKCFHSLSPAYQYTVESTIAQDEAIPIHPSPPLEIKLTPNHKDRLEDLTTRLVWLNSEHLNIQIFNRRAEPEEFSKPKPTDTAKDPRVLTTQEFDIDFSSQQGEFFHIRIGRNKTKETIFDTRIGPMIADDENFSFATLLPTALFYGLRGGQGNGGLIYDVVKGYNSMDLPFYISQETNGTVHGVFFQTSLPFIVQFTEAPAIMFHFEGPRPGINIHFFVGPTVKDVTRQMFSYLSEGQKALQKPPYWALGLHLCEAFSTGETANLEVFQKLAEAGIPYDSHCIDKDLRTPFKLDSTKYNETDLNEIVDYIRTNQSRRVFLTQKIGLPLRYYSDAPEDTFFINWPNGTVLVGRTEAVHVYYPNLYHDNTEDFLRWEFVNVNRSISEYSAGLTLTDNFPLDSISGSTCRDPSTRLQGTFLDGLVCSVGRHYFYDERTDFKTHLEVHNEYGHQGLRMFDKIFVESGRRDKVVMTSSSVTVDSFTYAGFNGLAVPFTWSGLMDSLTHLLRNFIALPFAGIPVCGSYLSANSTRGDDDLCLRWFQLGLLFPFARNTYGKDTTRGPLDFNKNDQQNLIYSIQERYRYNPYYYTLFQTYEKTGEPPIRPLSYDFDDPFAFNVLTQFMIGPALMAAPVISKSATTREAYFPPGTWYEVTGNLVYNDNEEGAPITIPGLASITPVFILGGHVIPTLTSPTAPTTELTRRGAYTILATYPTAETNYVSKGSLHVDDGLTFNSKFHSVSFQVTNLSVEITSDCNPDNRIDPISKSINQIKIYGFPGPQPEIKTNIPNQIRPKLIYSEDDRILRILAFEFDWCELPKAIFTWDPDVINPKIAK